MADEAARRPPVLLACPRCAANYGGMVTVDCPLCLGRARIAVQPPAGVPVAVAVRAVGLHLGVSTMGGFWSTTYDAHIPALRECGLLAPTTRGATALAGKLSGDPNDIGRAAGALLTEMGLRKRRAPKRKTPEELAEARAKKKRREEQAAEFSRELDRQREKRRARQLDHVALVRTGEAYLRDHPDEATEVLGNERAFAEIEKYTNERPAFDVQTVYSRFTGGQAPPR